MKGNPILGTGSGSIGDVTIMRRNGSQVTRVRLRKIKNPMSQGQAEQRMYMAPILKFYSPLAGVLETSFEGLNKADSYAKFISVNANLARANEWAVKKGSGFVALPYQVSDGTLLSIPMTASANNIVVNILVPPSAETPTMGSFSTALINAGHQAGDQMTIIRFTKSTKILTYKRFYLNAESTEEFADYGLIYAGGSIEVAADAAAIIMSRWDGNKWARSKAFVVCKETYLAEYTGDENLAAAIASYMKGAGQTPVSDVYLNGSDD